MNFFKTILYDAALRTYSQIWLVESQPYWYSLTALLMWQCMEQLLGRFQKSLISPYTNLRPWRIQPGKTKGKFKHTRRAELASAPPTRTQPVNTSSSSMLKSFTQFVHWTLTRAGSALTAAVQVLSQLRETGRVWICARVCVCSCSWDSRIGTEWADGNRPVTWSASIIK